MPPRKTPGRRKDDPENTPDGVLGALSYFIKSLGNPSDIKSTLAFLLAVATTVWAVAGIKADVTDLKPQVKQLAVDVELNERAIARQNQEIAKHDRELTSLQHSRDDLNHIIRKAVEAGVQRGVAKALREAQRR